MGGSQVITAREVVLEGDLRLEAVKILLTGGWTIKSSWEMPEVELFVSAGILGQGASLAELLDIRGMMIFCTSFSDCRRNSHFLSVLTKLRVLLVPALGPCIMFVFEEDCNFGDPGALFADELLELGLGKANPPRPLSSHIPVRDLISVKQIHLDT